MNDPASLGWLLPVWIIGAPFLAAVFSLFSMPKASGRHGEGAYDDRPASGLAVGAAGVPAGRH